MFLQKWDSNYFIQDGKELAGDITTSCKFPWWKDHSKMNFRRKYGKIDIGPGLSNGRRLSTTETS